MCVCNSSILNRLECYKPMAKGDEHFHKNLDTFGLPHILSIKFVKKKINEKVHFVKSNDLNELHSYLPFLQKRWNTKIAVHFK